MLEKMPHSPAALLRTQAPLRRASWPNTKAIFLVLTFLFGTTPNFYAFAGDALQST